MSEFLQYALLGVGAASVYALAAHGVIAVYLGSGVLNFAHGSIALLSARIFYLCWRQHGFPVGLSAVIAIATGAVSSLIVYEVVLRPLQRAVPLVKMMATVAVLIFVQELVVIVFSGDTVLVPQFLPMGQVGIGPATIGKDSLTLLAIVAVLTALMWALYRYTKFGVRTRASAEQPLLMRSLGTAPASVAAVNWFIGGLLAGCTGVLAVPITGLSVDGLVLLVVPAFAVAMVARLTSFPLALLAALVVGIGQSLITGYVLQPGWSDALPFLVIIAVLTVRGGSRPGRDHVSQVLPRVSPGRIRMVPALTCLAGTLALVWWGPASWTSPLTSTAIAAILGLSVVVLTGYAGQVSLGQYALAGVGGFVSARLAGAAGWPLWGAVVVGIGVATAASVVFAIPALRTRGIALAVVTLGLGLTVEKVIFGNPSFVGGVGGTPVPPPSLFGLPIDTLSHPRRFATLVIIVLVLIGVGVLRLRASVLGRHMLAVRANERAAASLGITVAVIKIVAFGIAAAIASTAGIAMAFRNTTVQYASYSSTGSLTLLAFVLVGGVGYVSGAYVGALLLAGGIVDYLLYGWLHADAYLALAGGVLLAINMIMSPDGTVPVFLDTVRRLGRGGQAGKLRDATPDGAAASGRTTNARTGAAPALLRDAALSGARRVAPLTLRASRVCVTYGGVQALDGVNLEVLPGSVVGLIGANGAGKSTLIDAISGFARMSGGSVSLDGVAIDGWSPERRARAGLARTFQSLELFEDLTVRENLLVGAEHVNLSQLARTIVAPQGSAELPPEMRELCEEFHLDACLDVLPKELPTGTRRLVGVARVIAGSPSIVLLDEPTAGLSEVEAAELGQVVSWLSHERGMGVLLVEHHLPIVFDTSDHVVAIDFGQLLYSGDVPGLQRDEAVRSAYLGVVEEIGGQP